MAPSTQRMSPSAPPPVNLHCLQCDSQIGIFDNEWTRLTSSYVRPVHPGTHFGTEIATRKTQVVPEGVTQRTLEGCTLAEVFCTQCSAAVGQYCKAIPAAAQRNMLNQYLYKLSRTYLKNGETNQRIDPVFSFGGDGVRATARPNAASAGSLVAPLQCSQTASAREPTPPRLQPMTESNRRTSVLISSQHNQEAPPFRRVANTEPQDSVVLQLAMQDTRLKSQDGRLAVQEAKALEHDTHLQAISSALNTFRETLEEIKISIEELRSQNSAPHLDKPTQIDFVGNVHKMIMTMKTAQSNAKELEELRAENAALKAKWDIVQSAMVTATGQPSPSSSFEVSHRSSLGKRKRDSNAPRSSAMVTPDTALQSQSHYSEDISSSTQIPTPQSSDHSDRQSADDSNSSRTSTPEQGQGRSKSPKIPQYGNKHTVQDDVVPTKALTRRTLRNRLPSNPSRRTEAATSSAVRSAAAETVEAGTQATSMVLDVEESQQLPTPGLVEESLLSPPQDDTRQNSILTKPATRPMNDEARPQVDDDAAGVGDSGGLADNNDEPPMDIDPVDAVGSHLSMRDTVEFSDNDQDRSSASVDTPADRRASSHMAPYPEVSPVDDVSIQSASDRRTRSKTTAELARRKTDFIINSRSVAPEPAALPRVLPRRLGAHQHARFEHATPESMEQELKEWERPKGPRRCKPHIQTTTKILNKELKELGLEDWIGKDKDDPEYKRVVEDARNRKREQSRLAALASRGISLPGALTDDEQPESIPTLEEAFHQATEALVDGNNEESGGKQFLTVSGAAARRAKGTGTRRKNREQREEEIRRRDLLAQAAMDIND